MVPVQVLVALSDSHTESTPKLEKVTSNWLSLVPMSMLETLALGIDPGGYSHQEKVEGLPAPLSVTSTRKSSPTCVPK